MIYIIYREQNNMCEECLMGLDLKAPLNSVIILKE